MPTRRLAASVELAFRVRRSRSMRAAHGARSRGAAFRAPGLFRRNRRGPEGRVLKPPRSHRTTTSTNNDDRHLSLTARDVDRDIAAVTAQQDIGGTMPPRHPAKGQLAGETRPYRPTQPDPSPGLT